MSINILENNKFFSENSSLVILLLIVVLVGITYYCLKTEIPTEYFNNNRSLLSTIYGVHSARNQNAIENKLEDNAIEIGLDDRENKVFKYKDNMYTINEENMLVSTEPKNITYKKVQTQLPISITADKIKSKIPLNFKEHKFKGLINNHWYRQYYILYEKEYDNQNFKNKYYTYLLVKNLDGKLSVVHKIPPRERIVFGDTIYFSYGNFQLGPLKFV